MAERIDIDRLEVILSSVGQHLIVEPVGDDDAADRRDRGPWRERLLVAAVAVLVLSAAVASIAPARRVVSGWLRAGNIEVEVDPDLTVSPELPAFVDDIAPLDEERLADAARSARARCVGVDARRARRVVVAPRARDPRDVEPGRHVAVDRGDCRHVPGVARQVAARTRRRRVRPRSGSGRLHRRGRPHLPDPVPNRRGQLGRRLDRRRPHVPPGLHDVPRPSPRGRQVDRRRPMGST